MAEIVAPQEKPHTAISDSFWEQLLRAQQRLSDVVVEPLDTDFTGINS